MARIRVVKSLSRAQLSRVSSLLGACGLRKRDLRRLRNAVAGSVAVAIAVEGRQLVGFGRLLGDSVYYASLWDIAVEPDFQGQGIGSAIVRELLKIARRQRLRMVGLFTANKNRRFYQQFGFRMLRNVYPMTLESSREQASQGRPTQGRARRR